MSLGALLESVPQAVRSAVAIVAAAVTVFTAGVAFNATTNKYSVIPEDVAELTDQVTSLRTEIAQLRGEMRVPSANAVRITYVEDAICTPTAIAVLGPDQDRWCYAMQRGRPSNNAAGSLSAQPPPPRP